MNLEARLNRLENDNSRRRPRTLHDMTDEELWTLCGFDHEPTDEELRAFASTIALARVIDPKADQARPNAADAG